MGTSTKGNVILTSFGIDVFMASFFLFHFLGCLLLIFLIMYFAGFCNVYLHFK